MQQKRCDWPYFITTMRQRQMCLVKLYWYVVIEVAVKFSIHKLYCALFVYDWVAFRIHHEKSCLKRSYSNNFLYLFAIYHKLFYLYRYQSIILNWKLQVIIGIHGFWILVIYMKQQFGCIKWAENKRKKSIFESRLWKNDVRTG